MAINLHLLRMFVAVVEQGGFSQAAATLNVTQSAVSKGVKELDINARTRNMLLSSARCLGERGFALLSQRWKTLQNITASPSEIGPIARAALVLVLFEHKRLE